ncbi:hypothetical protein WH96_17105 [Kiloniella spongiae]|uniref:HTH lysR-type domain-containing protein n=1 Tax=Kiloniella spongiae TaxID=1489064 RepID=A0A0H2MSH0_9PROT|nr:LysR family transcriptional regulator [Kiloniella spongiae]KLN59585.1 hypothetical protein WH96_17105 [Kiloniella spongiae]
MSTRNYPELTLRGLRAFVAVEETGSVSDGAKRIGGSSSGVSQQITALEEAVGAKLFDRHSRPLKLTPAGQMLQAHALKILKAVANAQAELSEHNLTDLPKLTLAIIDDLDTSLTPALVTGLQTRFKDCFVNAYSGRSDHIIELLQQRVADICVSANIPEDIAGFHSIPLVREPFILVTAKNLITNKQHILEELEQAPFIHYSEAIPMGRTITQHLKRVRFNVPQKFALEASRSVIALVAQTNGWAITTPLNLLDAERFISEVDVFAVPFPAFSRQLYMISRALELGNLPNHLSEECRHIIENQVIPRFANIVPHMSDVIKIIKS